MSALESPSIWAIGVLVRAVGGATGPFLLAWGATLMLLGAAWFLRRRDGAGWIVLGGFVALAVIFRDRNLLVGDARLWVASTEAFGLGMPSYREPLSLKLMGGVVEFTRGAFPTPLLLGLLTTGCGGLVVLALRAAHRPRRGAAAPAARHGAVASTAARVPGAADVPAPPPARGEIGIAFAVALLALQPISALFYGHIETYPLMLAWLAGWLVLVRREFARRHVGPLAWGGALGAVVLHGVAVVVIPPLAWHAARLAGWSARRAAGAAAAVVLAVALVLLGAPPLRKLLVVASSWSAAEAAAYVLDGLNGWVFALGPLGIALLARRGSGGGFAAFLRAAVVLSLAVPLVVRFELGAYRDLGILLPVAVFTAFLAAERIAAESLRPGRAFLLLLAGTPWLAAWLALGTAPAGARALEADLGRASLGAEARSYGWETLGYWHAERGALDSARAAMGEAVRVMPGNRRILGALGEMELAAGDTLAAVEHLRASLGTHRAPRTLPVLLEILARTGRFDEVEQLAREHADLVEQSGRAMGALAAARLRAGDPAAALEILADWLRLEPGSDVAHANRAVAYAQMGRLDEAIGAAREALRLDPERAAYHERYVRLLLAAGREEEAMRHLETLPPGAREAILGGGR